MFRRNMDKYKYKYLSYERACMDLKPSNLRIERLVQKLFWSVQKSIAKETAQPECKQYSTVKYDIQSIFAGVDQAIIRLSSMPNDCKREYECSFNLPEDYVERLQALHTLLQADFRRQQLIFQMRR